MGNKVGRLDPQTGDIRDYDLSAPDIEPFCITGGPDGNVRVALQKNRIVRISLK